MNRLLFFGAFFLGAAAITWMGASFVGSNQLALAIIAVIACVYVIGFVELLRFRRGTATLDDALGHLGAQPPASLAQLDAWLYKLDPSLQNPVRLRIEGERVGLPAPTITPYLVGLLVMLGLLGTFAGMVETLQGAVLALEGTTELQAIRSGLAAPIEGLSLAFGTSVAGIAASAMLGLISTLSRSDRMLATRRLDTVSLAQLRHFSQRHSTQQAFVALREQAAALPQVAGKLEAMADKLAAMGDTLGDKLMDQQALFQQSVKGIYTELASAVDVSLRESLADSGRLAGEGIRPLVQETMAGIGQQAVATHQQLTQIAQHQLDSLTQRFADTAEQVSSAWQQGLGAQEQCNDALRSGMGESFDAFRSQFEQLATATLESMDQRSAAWVERQQADDRDRLGVWSGAFTDAHQHTAAQFVEAGKLLSTELAQIAGVQQTSFAAVTRDFGAMSGELNQQWLQAGERMAGLLQTLGAEMEQRIAAEAQRDAAALDRLASLESTVATHLSALGQELEQPMVRLMEVAAETPRAAAQLIADLRSEMRNNIERDNSMLEERRIILAQLDTLGNSLRQNSGAQREAVEQLVSSANALLQDTGANFRENLAADMGKVAEVAHLFAGSATEMASLGEAFTLAIGLFNESNGQLVENLARIESSLDNATARSDEQMAYYVAQAREIIDQSMLSQREVFAQLQQLAEQQSIDLAEAD
jgi:hypothetical protein